MIFVDSSVPMYLVGSQHRHERDAIAILERLVTEHRRLVTDAEAYQEILHRYRAIDRTDMIQPAFDALDGVVDEVLAVTEADVREAKDVLLRRRSLGARDALHVAVMRAHGIARIVSFDRDFDSVPGLTRIGG